MSLKSGILPPKAVELATMEYHTCIHNEILLYLLLWINDFKCNLHLLRSKNIVNMNISALESCDL